MKFSIVYFFILAFIFSCSRSPPLSEKQILFRQMIDDYILDMEKNENMAVYGSGGGISGGEKRDLISIYTFDFSYPKLMGIEEARSTLLRCTKSFLEMINGNEKIRPYLTHYPYTVSGFELTLKFLPFEESNPDSKKVYVHTVLLFGSEIHYRQYNPAKKGDETLLIETYEEALEAEKMRMLSK